ncbi:MAG: DUF1307 domain-containing protein [Bacilli bacterium]|nr:DUF1307 domain-containing protein [Bacilli bacterium]
MKKFVKLTFAFMLVVLLTGCLGKDKVTKCTLKSDQSASGYKITSEYNVYSSKDEVNKVVTTETVESKNNTILAYFEKQLKSQYKANNDSYGGYKYEITNKDGKVVSKVTIDYSKMNLNKFVKDNPAMKSYVNKSNKITVKGIKSMYQSMGATCEK